MDEDLLVVGSISRRYNAALPHNQRGAHAADARCSISCRVTSRSAAGEDPFALVHLPIAALQQLRCTSGVLVQLSSARNKRRTVLAKAAAIEEQGATEGRVAPAEIPPTVAWALGEPSFRDVAVVVQLAQQIAPVVATEVRLARVVTADSDGSANYASAIARHFVIPRLVREGDIVPVAVTDLDLAGGEEHGAGGAGAVLTDPLIMPMRTVFFQVTSVSGRSGNGSTVASSNSSSTDEVAPLYEVSRRHTTLVQQGAVQILQPDHVLVAEMLRVSTAQHLATAYVQSKHTGLPDRKLVSTVYAEALNNISEFCQLSLSEGVAATTRQHLQQLRLLIECAHVEDVKLVMDFAAARLGMDSRTISLRQLIGHTEVPSHQLIHAFALQLRNVSPCILVVTDVDEAFRSSSQRDSQEETDSRVAEALMQLWAVLHSSPSTAERLTRSPALWSHTTATVITVGVVSSTQALGPRTRALFAQEYVLPGMNAAAAVECASYVWNSVRPSSASDIEKVTRSLVGRSLTDGLMILAEAKRLAVDRASACADGTELASYLQQYIDGFSVSRDEGWPTEQLSAAVTSVLLREPRTMAKSSIPDVKWEDIGGLDYVRHEIVQTMEIPLKYPELFGPSVPRRRAILLYGPPGTGKTLVAKAVATECDMNFMSVKGPELLDMYVGESERNVRLTFEEARKNAPCVLFFDELDSLAPKRGRGSDAGGVMDRVVSQLLSEMDTLASEDTRSNETPSPAEGASQHAGVFVIAATNRPDLLDPSLLRPGRFDRKLYLGTNQTVESRLGVLRAQTRKFKLHDDVDFAAVAEALPVNTTGADIGSLTSQAYMTALGRKLQGLEDALKQHNEQDHYGAEVSMTTFLEGLDPSEFAVVITQKDLVDAARNLQPSVSLAELQHYERLREQFSDA